MSKNYRVVDDDGVVVLVSEKAAQRRYAGRAFGYKYPDELLEAMRAGEIFAWRAGAEGEHSIRLVYGDPEPDGPATVRGFIRVADGDRLLLMPYSQYSYDCSANGRFEFIDGLCAVVSTHAGLHEVSVVLVGSGLPSISDNRFDVGLTPTAVAEFEDLTEVPGWR